jgi:hypothetical protein
MLAVTGHTWTSGYPYDDRLEAAWGGVVEHILAAPERPSGDEVIRAGWTAIRAHCDSQARFRGARTTEHRQRAGGFPAYWFDGDVLAGSIEERVTERVALAQIWPRMREADRQLLEALAEHDDYGLAAASLGIPRPNYATKTGRARARFRQLWHEGETPSRPWGADRRGDPGNMPITYRIKVRRRAAARRQASKGGGE